MAEKKLMTCLWFDGQGEEAAKFYTSVFEDSSIGLQMDFDEASSEVSGQPKGSLMVVEFEIMGQRFMALNGGPQFKFNESISFVIDCDDQKEVDYYWSRLTADGGEESMCGWLKDKFGVSWQVVPKILNELLTGPDPEGAKRATEAMLKMRKLDIQKLQDAYDGK